MASSSRLTWLHGLAFGLLAAGACGSDAKDEPPPASCTDECEMGELRCTEGIYREQCDVGAEGCRKWVVADACGASEMCEGGECVACANGCCRTCDTYECGPGSDDGCGGTCGGATDAWEGVPPVATAICTITLPCCDRGELVCNYDSMSECEDNYATGIVGTGSPDWCDYWVETCLEQLATFTCQQIADGLPPACEVLVENPFTVVPDPNEQETCTPDSQTCSPYRCGSNGTCLDSCVSKDDCLGDHVCKDGQCQVDSCERTSDCVGYLCDDGLCATTCASSAQCQNSHYCNDADECVPDECAIATESTDCNGYRCWDDQCQIGCTHDGECADTHACVELEGICLGKCGELGDSVCSGYRCADDGLCRTTCDPIKLDDCYIGHDCVDGACVPS
jgi:hypothetical protein